MCLYQPLHLRPCLLRSWSGRGLTHSRILESDQVQLQCSEVSDLHPEDALPIVVPVFDVDKVHNPRSLDLLDLGCSQYSSHPHQLQLVSADGAHLDLQETVHDCHGGVEGLLEKMDLKMNPNQPV